MATTLNVSSLPDYVNVHRDELLVKASMGSKVLDYVEIMPNVKYKDALNYLDTEIEFQTPACDWNPNGAVNFAQRYIETHPIESQLQICWLDFQKKYMNYQLNYEAGRETLPFEEKLVNSFANNAKDAVETLLFVGASGLGITGWIADAAADSATSVSFASGATAVEKVDSVVAALDMRMLKKGVNIFMSYSDLRSYIQESNGTCCANRAIIDAASEELTYIGDSRIKLIPVLGLEDTGVILAATPDALVFGTDIEGAESVFDVWYDKDTKNFKFQMLTAIGTAIKWPNEVVVGSAE